MTSEASEGTGNNEKSGQTKSNANNEESKGFTKEYVQELRNESQSLRQKLIEAENSAKQQLLSKEAELDKVIEAKIGEVSETYKKEIMIAKLEAKAIKAGIVDVDGIKLADLSKVKFGENNQLEGADELIEELKKEKPYLFSKNESSTSKEKLPKPANNATKSVKDVSPKEYDAIKKAELARQN